MTSALSFKARVDSLRINIFAGPGDPEGILESIAKQENANFTAGELAVSFLCCYVMTLASMF